MKHLILVVTILILFAGNTFGQKVIYGKVSDAKTGEPLPFSNVSAVGYSTTVADTRLTLYWNATLRADKDGNTTIKFYNTDSTRKLLVVVEGIANGIPIYSTTILGEK